MAVFGPIALSSMYLPADVLLNNTAQPGVYFPANGLGTGCAVGGCNAATRGKAQQVAEQMTAQWLRLGGRRIDSADSYGIGHGVGRAVAASGVPRSEIFIVSKTGPGGLCYPLGYNETLSQARGIAANLSTTPDLLLIHWPTNYGPCAIHGPHQTIPTSDPLCDIKKSSYSEAGCRVSSWRGMVAAWKLGLARAVGVSNFNSTHLHELHAAGLPMPSVGQNPLSPHHGPHHARCTPGATETCGELLATHRRYGILYNGYSPFGGAGGAGALFREPRLLAIAARHNATPAAVVLSWQWRGLGVAVNPEAVSEAYQRDNLHGLGVPLTADEIAELSAWDQ